MARILVINSSPRANSNTRALAAALAEGAEGKGHSIKTVEIGKTSIRPCIGCETCHGKTPGKCVYDDAMTGLLDEMASADAVVFSSPVYYFTINAQMKLFIDRTYAAGAGLFKGKKIAAVFAYGDVDPVKSGCVNAIRMFQDICAYVEADWAGAVYGTAWDEGDVKNNPALLLEAREFGSALL